MAPVDDSFAMRPDLVDLSDACAVVATVGTTSSAASAANAAIDHMRDWALGTNGEWVTITPEGFFTASEKGASLLYVVKGFEITSIDQVYQSISDRVKKTSPATPVASAL